MIYEMSGKYEIAVAIIEATIAKKPSIKLIEDIPAWFQVVEIESDEYELCKPDETGKD